MVTTIISGTILTIIGSIIGYLIGLIKKYKETLNAKSEENKIQKDALMAMIQSNLTNTYYVYEKIQQIPDYVYKNWCNMKSCYEKLGGNDYIHVLDEKMKHWDFEKTDILKK